MKRDLSDIQHLVQQYEQKLSEAPTPLWMDAPDILDVLDYYEQANLYFESEQCMRIALKLHPDNPEVITRRAYRLKNEGKWAEAVEWMKNVPQQDSLDARFFYAEMALSVLDFDRAETLFNEALKSERDIDAALLASNNEKPMGIADLLLEIGELFIDYGSISRAQKYLNQVANDTAEYARAQMLLAECSFQLGDTTTSISQLEKILDEDPYYLDAWIMMADVCNEAKQFEKCTEAANFALAIDPQNEKALRFKAVAALGAERYDDVLEVYDTYYPLYPTDYTMALSAGEILINQQKFSQARIVLTRSNQSCPNENPDKVRILSDIALTYAAESDLPKAYETLLGCCSLGSSYGDVVLQAVHLGLQHRQLPFSMRLLEHYFETYPLNAETRLRIAKMLAEANIFAEVLPAWLRLLNVTENGTTLAAPYLAFAARRLMRIREYKFWLAYSIYEDPTTAQQIFKHIYPNVLPQDYLAQAHNEFPETDVSTTSDQQN